MNPPVILLVLCLGAAPACPDAPDSVAVQADTCCLDSMPASDTLSAAPTSGPTGADGVLCNDGCQNAEAGGTPASSMWAEVYCYPNPYSPWQAVGMTFVNLPDRIRMRVIDASGYVLFDRETPTAQGNLNWDVRSNAGQDLPTGVYVYVITDGAGQFWSDRLAVKR